MDFYNDQGAFLVKLLHAQPVPDFVKQSGYESEEAVSALPGTAFADQDSRLFPIHTPADVYLSAAYLHGKNASVDLSIAESVDKAAQLFDIQSEVADVIAIAKAYNSRTTKVAAPSGGWSFTTKTASFAGQGESHLRSAAAALENNYRNYSFGERTEIAENLVKVAGDLGVDLPVAIEKFAGMSHVNPDDLIVQLQARALALNDPRRTEDFLSKIALIKQAAAATPQEAMKVAAFLDGFDRENHLTRFYGSRISDPHTAVFNTPMAEHLEKTAMVKIGNVKHYVYDLRSVDGDVFAEVLGHKVADVRELANLDEEQARLVNQLLA